MTNLIESALEKFAPNFNKQRLDMKKERNKAILKKFRQGQQLTSRQEMLMLDMLNKRGMIPKNKENASIEKKLYMWTALGVGAGTIIAFSPYLIREFYNISSVKQAVIVSTLFMGVSALVISPAYLKTKLHNRQLIRQNVYKIYESEEPTAKELREDNKTEGPSNTV